MTTSPTITDDMIRRLQGLNRAVASDLWRLYRDDETGPHLMLPTKRDATSRISEQESKIVFCHRLERSDWFYSIETPTVKTYQQSGKSSRSANTDVSLYADRDIASKCVNVELKAQTPNEESYRKDLEKLLREGITGIWFHTLRNTNSGTLPSIFDKMRSSFHRLEEYVDGPERSILFAFCVLERRRLLQGILQVGGVASDTLRRVDQLFETDSLISWDEWTDSVNQNKQT